MAQDNEFLRKLQETFQLEAGEHLQEISSNLVLLESAHEPAKRKLIDRILKRLHTLKGAARAVNLTDLETLSHSMEEVLSGMAATNGTLSADQFDTLHQAGELARSLMSEPAGRVRNQAVAMIARLGRLITELKASAVSTTIESDSEQRAASASMLGDSGLSGAAPETEMAFATEPESGRDNAPQRHFLRMDRGDLITVQGKSLDAVRYQAEAFLATELSLHYQIENLLALADELSEECVRLRTSEAASTMRSSNKFDFAADHSQEAGLQLGGPVPGDRVSSASVQSSPGRQNQLADLVGNAEARCRKAALDLRSTRRSFAATRAKLMDATLATALVPFSSALEPLSAAVRNLARSRGKHASLIVEDESVRVDRRILAVVRDVLQHLVTNAVDHGIEPEEERIAAGKTASGTVRVRVTQTGGNEVLVTVADDGAGMDLEALVNVALAQGILQPDRTESMSDGQKRELALRSGLSTSRIVTQVSGRGVGLTIAAEQIASVGGRLVMDSTVGSGSIFQLFLPVRLATLRGLVLRVGATRYVAPLNAIDSVLALKPDDIQTIEGRETIIVRGRVVSVIRLRALLRVERSVHQEEIQDDKIAVIARAGPITFAILVDEVIAEQEVLPKDLGKQLRRVRYVASVTQLGDGCLVPILNLDDVADFGVVSGAGQSAVQEGEHGTSMKRMLVVEDSITSRLLLKHILESAGYKVETAVDGLDALSKLRQEEFDAVISDIEMPQLDGLRLTERIRSNPKTEELPVILVTSLQSAEEKTRGLHAGADAYVVKGSFDQDNLLTTIRRLV